MHPALQAFVVILVGVGGCVGYFYASNLVLDKILFPARGPHAGRNINRASAIRPWLFLFPALALLCLYLAYPVFATAWLSLHGRSGQFVGGANYIAMFGEPKFAESLKNNMLWLVVVPAASTAFGLLAAQLTDRIKWGNIAKSLIFMPMAISFVGASVIFKLIYDARDAEVAQIGLLNALWLKFDGGPGSFLFLKLLPFLLVIAFVVLAVALAGYAAQAVAQTRKDFNGRLLAGGIVFALLVVLYAIWGAVGSLWGLVMWAPPFGQPQNWLQLPFWNNFFLMAVLVWIQTGFAMVILSAALRGVPEDTIEAAIIDGANPFQIFFKIKVPQIMGTIVVVWTTITITVLKVFDIVLAMTNGQWETQVLANYMYDKLFRSLDWGMGSASAMIIMLLVTPILVWNVWNVRKEMK
ncbi:sugar ABC transporter permease [Rhodobacter sp. Har01]|uniref:carbohydrate ABC transporter permease n=1 Tax=Rhodobacter sp. Har01 TaxID=2883999 RepID=UPI001D05FD3C|nr:sugar ABC transporter permease [Rhodobacter sp. Har01]MCB6177244.1 sugar ABC transporter permease [Rhodobacter sp. Har01]